MTRRFDDLADGLQHLKGRSGRSYAWISGRVNMSKATVHRYCAGVTVPPEFGTVERIAKVCGATQDELSELYRLWEQTSKDQQPDFVRPEQPLPTPSPDGPNSDGPGSDGPGSDGPGSDGPDPDGPGPAGPPSAAPQPPDPHDLVGLPPDEPVGERKSFRTVWLAGLAAAVAVLVLTVLIIVLDQPFHSSGTSAQAGVSPPAQRQKISGPAWVQPPDRLDGSYFGVTMNSATGTMPGFQVGSVRLWDSNTRWSSLQPQRGVFDWSTADRLVGAAGKQRLPVVFVFGGTPQWASPTGPLGPYEDGARASAPDDLADWDDFVRQVAVRFAGRIDAYELWVLANDPHFYVGSVDTLVEMTKRASRIIRAADPKAKLVCPSMGRLWEQSAQDVLRRFAALGGYDFCDAAGIKLHQQVASDPPETMVDLAVTIERLLHTVGVHPPLWDTGTSYDISLQDPLPEETAANYAVRFYLVGIYAKYRRMYFYNWGGTHLPIVLQPDGGLPTTAALQVARLQEWLVGGKFTSCGQGTSAGLAANVWQCTFNGGDGHPDGVIRWTHDGTAKVQADPRATSVRHLDGTTTPTTPGADLLLTGSPILITLN